MKKYSPYVLALIIFILCTIYITWPLPFNLSRLVTGYGDELVISWIMNWNIHALTHNPFSLFSANTYYPYLFSLTYSELLLTSSVFAIIPELLFKESITAFNFTVFSSFLLVSFFSFILLYHQTKNFFSSLIAALLLMFSPVFIDKKVHVQVLAIYWIPLSVLFFIEYLKNKHIRFLIISLIFFILQIYNSFLPGYFLIFFYGVSFLLWTKLKIIKIKQYISKKSLGVLLITLLLLIPIVTPYYVVSNLYNAKRNIRDAIHYGLQFEDLLYPNEHTRLWPILNRIQGLFQSPISGEAKYGYIGGVFTLLTAISTILVFKKKYRKNIAYLIYMVCGWVGFIISLGPALHLFRQTVHIPFVIPLPYAVLYYLAPGFMGFRNAARFEMMFILFMAFAIAHFLPMWLKKVGKTKQKIIYGVIILLIIIELPGPIKFINAPRRRDFPKVYSWLATTPKETKILELPIYNWYIQPFTVNEIFHQYYSTIHFRRIINGASGYAPDEWVKLARLLLHEFPSDTTLKRLQSDRIDFIIIHTKEYEEMNASGKIYDGRRIRSSQQILGGIEKYKELKLINKFGNDYVYLLKR